MTAHYFTAPYCPPNRNPAPYDPGQRKEQINRVTFITNGRDGSRETVSGDQVIRVTGLKRQGREKRRRKRAFECAVAQWDSHARHPKTRRTIVTVGIQCLQNREGGRVDHHHDRVASVGKQVLPAPRHSTNVGVGPGARDETRLWHRSEPCLVANQ